MCIRDRPTSITRDGHRHEYKPSRTNKQHQGPNTAQSESASPLHLLSPITTCKHTPPRARHNTHILTPPTETHQIQQIPVPHQGDTQHRPQALQEMETDTDTNHPGPQATPTYKHKTARVSLSTSSSLSNHNLQTHTSKGKTQTLTP